MEKFSKYLTEGRKSAGMDTDRGNGTSAKDLLQDYYIRFAEESWKNAQLKDIKSKYGVKYYGAHFNYLLNNDYIDRAADRVYSITVKGLNYIKQNGLDAASSTDDIGIAKGVKDVSLLKTKKFIVPKIGNNSKYLGQMKKILSHMEGFASGGVKTTFMLGGDPGTGKTSLIRSLSTLTGIPLVIIEAPHITQEHLINIPFLVIDGQKQHKGNVSIDDSPQNMKVVQAESNLVTQLKTKHRKTEQQIQTQIDKNRVLKEIYPMLEKRINRIKDSYNSILFLDEFYRTSSIKIRNVLRNILNGKIGNDKIPKGVYIIMASNINDEGVEDIPLNQDFHLIDHDVASKEDFMSFMYSKYVDNPEDNTETTDEDPETQDNGAAVQTASGISIKPEVWNKFMDKLTDKDLGFNDASVDVRLSPRRLEQMIIYVDGALPVQNVEEATNLIAFIRNNLSNYIDEQGSTVLINKFQEIVKELLQETSADLNLDIEKIIKTPTKKSEWRSQLQHELQMKIKLGDNRQYVPVVSGQPGVGKTSQMAQMANEMAMGFIHVDVSNLTPEDITGLPIADMNGDNITTEFSEPNLYITIMQDYNSQINDFKQEGRKYNMILLFDELNRATVPVFNSIRKVLLEKEFENVALPSDILITGAINPNDIGAIEFTGHTRDVLDIIPSAGSFKDTYEYIKNKKPLVNISESLGFDLHGGVLNLLTELANGFRSAVDADDNPLNDKEREQFWWSDSGNIFYVSPREVTECVSNSTLQIRDVLEDMNYDIGESYTEEDFEKLIDGIVNTCADSFLDTFNMITLKQQINGFSKMLAQKIVSTTKYRKFFENIKTKKSANVLNLVQILDNAEGDVNFFDKGVVGNYIKDFTSTEMVQDIATISDSFISTMEPMDSLTKISDMYSRIKKSLEGLNASGNYNDQLNRYTGAKIASILKAGNVNVLDIMDNAKLMQKLGQFM